MGFPFTPHPRETTVLSKHFGEPEARTLDGWKARGGYRALEQALGMDPLAIQQVVKDSFFPPFNAMNYYLVGAKGVNVIGYGDGTPRTDLISIGKAKN
jgi:hypothetical protein